jgi:peptidoglycan hydrolase-like protein with peptidoglycan-binding domain
VAGDAGNEIKGHRDGYSTDCPGPKLYAWVKAGAPRPGSTSPSSPPWPGRLLKVQPPLMHGDDVIMVQRWLNMTGSEIDGVYGPKTQKAVRTYQAKHGLDVDGIVGRKTWDSLAR